MGMLGDTASDGALVDRTKANSKAATKALNCFPDISHLLSLRVRKRDAGPPGGIFDAPSFEDIRLLMSWPIAGLQPDCGYSVRHFYLTDLAGPHSFSDNLGECSSSDRKPLSDRKLL